MSAFLAMDHGETIMRLTERKLPLDHSASDLHNAIIHRLGIAADELLGFTIFHRSHDAR